MRIAMRFSPAKMADRNNPPWGEVEQPAKPGLLAVVRKQAIEYPEIARLGPRFPDRQGQPAMATTAFNCPGCRVLLKPTTPVPAGKKIKCPKCGAVFTVTVKSSTGAGGPDKKRPPAPDPLPTAEPLPDEGNWEVLEGEEVEKEEPAAPVRARCRAAEEDLDEEDEEAVPVRRRSPRRAKLEDEADDEEDESDDDWEEEDEGPRRPSSSRKAGRSIVLTILIATLVTGLAAVGGIGGTIWWYLNRDRNRGTGKEVPLAFVPSDSSAVMGMDIAKLLENPTIVPWLDKAGRDDTEENFLQLCEKATGLQRQELREHQFMAFGGREARPGVPTKTVVLQSCRPFDQRKIRDAAREAKAQRFQGRTYFKVNEPLPLLYMPSDRIIVASNLPEAEFQMIVGNDGTQPSLPPAAMNMLKVAEEKQAWLVAPVTESSRVNFPGFANAAGPAGQQVPPDLRDALDKSKAFGFWADLSGDQVRCTIALSCVDGAAAEKAIKAVQPTMAQLKSPATLIELALMPKSIQTLFKEFTDSLAFSTRGDLAQMSFQLKTSSLEAVANDPQAQGMTAMGGGMQPGGPGPGGPSQGRGRMGGGPGGMPGPPGRSGRPRGGI
jgi:hypothetical protein